MKGKIVSQSVIIGLVCLILGAMVVLPSNMKAEDPPDEVVTFPDPGLEAAIRDAIDKPAGDIYNSDLETLTYLHAGGMNIYDLSGLEYCINLEDAYIRDNHISDLQPLANLTSLQNINAYGNEISNLQPLAGLGNLEELSIDVNQVIDLQPLASLANLRRLSLYDNQVSDLQPLSGMNSLGVCPSNIPSSS